jgi:hypothetical protein
MKVGDHVDVHISTGEKVGPGKIVRIITNDPMAPVAGTTTIKVVVERPRGGPYEFGAPQSKFKQVGPDRWEVYMGSPTRGEFLLDEEKEEP